MNLRRALLLSTGDRYIGMIAAFAALAVVSRVLTPSEIGLMAVGMAIMNLVETLRDSGATSFVIQQNSGDQAGPRTAFTLMLALTLALAIPLAAFAGPLSALYGEPRLVRLLQVLALAMLPGPLVAIPLALLRRDMAFYIPALVNIATAATVAVVTIIAAITGAGYLSSVYGFVAGNWLAAALLIVLRRDLIWVYRPALARLRETLSFGGYAALAALLNGLYEFLPNLYLGRVLGLDALGTYNRAYVTHALPDKLILTGLLPVALPAFSGLARDGHSLKIAYLRGLCYLSAVKWPVHILFAILAGPIVRVLLGPQWAGVVPLLQALSLAAMIAFPIVLTWPVLVAAGAVNRYLTALLVSIPTVVSIHFVAAHYGLKPLIWSYFATQTVLILPGLVTVKRVLAFGWREAAASLKQSAELTAISMALPALAYAAIPALSLLQAVAIAAVGVCGWFVGLRITQHPLLTEVRRAIDFSSRPDTLDRLPKPLRAALAVITGRPVQ